MTYFVFYRGEKPQFVGIAEDCARHFMMSIRSVQWYATPAALRRANQGIDNQKLYAEKVEVDL